MSRVRGGNNFSQIRFSSSPLQSHSSQIDLVVPLDEEALIQNRKYQDTSRFVIDHSLKGDAPHHSLRLPFREIAKQAGNEKAFTSAFLGAVWKFYNLPPEILINRIQQSFSEELAQINMLAAEKGYKAAYSEDSLEVPEKKEGRIFINGNQAIAFGALMAGCTFYAAYPMTPSTSIMNELAAYALDYPIIVEQAEDEIAAMNMAVGSAFAGARSMTGTSGGGFSLMVEGLGLAGISETPVVVVDAMRPGPATGFATRTCQGDLSFVLTASQGEFPRAVIAPKDQSDCFASMIHAFDLAEKYQTPVLVLTDQYLADARNTIPAFIPGEYNNQNYLADISAMSPGSYKRYQLTESGISPRIYPGQFPGQVVLQDSYEHDEEGHDTESAELGTAMMNKRMKKEKLMEQDMREPEILGSAYSETLLLSWGSTCGTVKEAIAMLENDGIQVTGLHFTDLWPLPKKVLGKLCSSSKQIINIEHNYTGQLAKLIRQETGVAVTQSILAYDGRQMSPEFLYQKLREVLK